MWRARDERLDRDIAVKLLGAGADEAFRERFTDEARRAAAIGHPNVVAVFDEGRDGPDAYMVMEYVRGRTLRDVIAERGALPLREAARLVAQVAAALDAAHAAGVVHCDVKPANVIVDDTGLAKLADFGVARAARGPAERELIGTARYIAPERIEGKAPTPRSDVYSLGLVAYELIAGCPAYGGMETEDLLRHRLTSPAPSLRSARVGVPAEIDAVVARALARDPERRQGSAGEFARALRGAVERGDDTRTAPVPAPVPAPARPLRRPRRTPGRRITTGFAARTDVGRVRSENEDRYLARAERGVTLLAVADGVGGDAGGDVASAVAVEALASTFAFDAADPAGALASAMRAANDAVLRASRERGHGSAASTLVAAAIRARDLTVANLGDSRAYLVRDGGARQITADHSGLAPNSITRFVGDPRGVLPDVFVEALRPGDRLVLCSDGLSRHVGAEEIAQAASGAPPERAAESLVGLANDRGGEDNVTVVVYAAPSSTARAARIGLLLLAGLVVLAVAGAIAGALSSGFLPR